MPRTENRFDWDDLRYVLAVARGGSLSAAARALGVNHSTVYRRLAGLEGRLGARLFDRDGGRLSPTAAGEDLLASAGKVEAELLALDGRLAGRDLRLTGRIRVTAPDDIAWQALGAPLARFRADYPGVTLDLVIDNRMLSLTRREADVAVRPTRTPPETLVGRKVGPIESAVYLAAGRLAEAASEATGDTGLPAGTPWIAWDEGEGPAAARHWLAARVPAAAIVYRSNSMLHQAAACRAGIGAALLPCPLGDADPELARAGAPLPDLATDLWLLTHPDLRRTARVKALMAVLYEGLRSQKSEDRSQRPPGSVSDF